MDKIWWNEQWMGWPIGPQYEASSNVVHAGKLQGKLLLVVPELDTNVDPSSTLQVVNALIKANKYFDMLVMPGEEHGGGRRGPSAPYGDKKLWDFFVTHLIGSPTPDWNAVKVPPASLRQPLASLAAPAGKRSMTSNDSLFGPSWDDLMAAVGARRTRVVTEVRMDTFLQDFKYGVRNLLRQRGSSIVAVVTLALGIGASTAIFSVVDAAMLRPLPYPKPEQLVSVNPEQVLPDGKVSRATASMEDMRFMQKADDVFSQVAAWGSAFRGRIAEGPEPERIQVAHYTEDYLPMHGVTPQEGRELHARRHAAGRAAGGAARPRLLAIAIRRRRRARTDDPARGGHRGDRRRAAAVVQREHAGLDSASRAAGGVRPPWHRTRVDLRAAA